MQTVFTILNGILPFVDTYIVQDNIAFVKILISTNANAHCCLNFEHVYVTTTFFPTTPTKNTRMDCHHNNGLDSAGENCKNTNQQRPRSASVCPSVVLNSSGQGALPAATAQSYFDSWGKDVSSANTSSTMTTAGGTFLAASVPDRGTSREHPARVQSTF